LQLEKTMKTSSAPRLFFVFCIARLAAVLLVGLALTSLALAAPIHDAAVKGDVKKIAAILAADPTQINAKDKLGNTPLHYAAFHGNLPAVKALIDAGADVKAKNSYGPFLPGDLGGAFWSGSQTHQDPVFLLQMHGVNTADMQNGYTPLDLTMFSSRHKEIVDLLLAKGADVNAQASSGATPLFWAVMRDQKDDVVTLLAKGANVNLADAYGDTILDCALHLNYVGLVPILVDHGADVNAVDQSMHRPLTYALGMDDTSIARYLKAHGAHE
jgi:ankyrin repeat protein